MRLKLAPTFARFFLVGLVGFGVDASVLTVLIREFDSGLYGARLVSFSLAVTATWWLNRHVTFRAPAGGNRRREYGRYFLVQTTGAMINLGVYVIVIQYCHVCHRWPVIPLAAGSAVALLFNFVGARRLAFGIRD